MLGYTVLYYTILYHSSILYYAILVGKLLVGGLGVMGSLTTNGVSTKYIYIYIYNYRTTEVIPTYMYISERDKWGQH